MIQTVSLPRPVVAAAIVDSFQRPTQLLCTARAYPAKLRGFYEFPGGKVEVGEDPRHALKREVAEELGVTISLGAEVRPMGSEAVLDRTDKTAWEILEGRTMRVWVCELLPQQHASPGDSHLDAIWVSLDRVADLPWLPSNEPILRQLLTILRG